MVEFQTEGENQGTEKGQIFGVGVRKYVQAYHPISGNFLSLSPALFLISYSELILSIQKNKYTHRFIYR